MKIDSIHLKNIRSYANQQIDFNTGITVLSGDIGAGKSTLLQAIECALFGFTTQEGGSGLLRKGQQEGSVVLHISLDNKKIAIERTLKHKTDGIRQGTGALILDGTKKEMTAVELKDAVLRLLGYPIDTASRRASIYRYTTYTPQEELKAILHEDNDERVTTIKKLFGIDKYQRIIENSALITRGMREQKRELVGSIADLQMKKEFISKLKEKKQELVRLKKESEEKVLIAKEEVAKTKQVLAQQEQEQKKIEILKREKAVLENTIKQQELQKIQLEKEILQKTELLEQHKKALNLDVIDELKKKIKTDVDERRTVHDKELFALQKRLGELEAIQKQSAELKKKIESLTDCPLCLQQVQHTHKQAIIDAQNEKHNSSEVLKQEVLEKSKALQEQLQSLQKEMLESKQAEKELFVLQTQIKAITEKEIDLRGRKEQLQQLLLTIDETKKKTIIIPEHNELQYQKTKQLFEEQQRIERQHELEYTKHATEFKNAEEQEVHLQKEIDEKELKKQKLSHIQTQEEWMEKTFVGIIESMERHVVSKTYSLFNEEFKTIFQTIISDEQLSARISDSFAPVLEQNNYETEFNNLSGGEKASVALAYRLALHATLNSMIATMRTKNILLLDEPTDGFSSEQLDVLKEVFANTKATQTILVSHEQKIESFADHVIHIAKQGHESVILQ